MGMKLAVQNYTLRDLMAEDFFGTLERVKALGLNYCELAGLGGNSPETIKAELDRIGLQAMGAHAGFDWSSDSVDSLIHEAKTIGYTYVILPWIGKEHYQDGWKNVAEMVIPRAEKLHAAGLKFLYHNHDFEFAKEADGTPGYDVFLASTPANLVGIELDTYWVQAAGYNPADYIRRFAGRVPSVHLKDMSAGDKPTYVPGGEGILDWTEILAAANEAGSEYGVIELDVCPREPMECVEASVRFFRSRGLVE